MDRTDQTEKVTPLKETVSYINTLGFTENFYVYSAYINVDTLNNFYNSNIYTKEKLFYLGIRCTGRYLQ